MVPVREPAGAGRVSKRRLIALLIVVFLIGAAGGFYQQSRQVRDWLIALNAPVVSLPRIGARPGPVLRFQGTTALALLGTLKVQRKAESRGYRRENFGLAWSDVDGNACDTRNDILRRDLRPLEMMPDSVCLVKAGVLHDPYTGQQIHFNRGAKSSALVQIDHLVALSDAWRTGAAQLTAQQRLAFANDPLNLMAVDGESNQRKSDADAANWLPANTAFRCEYVSRQISAKAAYSLWVSVEEKASMLSTLRSCPTQRSFDSGLHDD